jgi:hypothetical protein
VQRTPIEGQRVRILRWSVWSLGGLATIVIVIGVAFMQAGPSWYVPVFNVAAIYCILAVSLAAYLRWKRSDDESRRAWLQALSTGGVGFIAFMGFVMARIAIAVVTQRGLVLQIRIGARR